MRIAPKSASASVTRLLEAIILQSGHEIARTLTDVDFLLEDTLHPVAETIESVARLQLVAQEAVSEGAMTCPLRPERLIQRLAMLDSTRSVALGADWMLDRLARNLHHRDGGICTLTEKECSLLNHLAQSHPHPLSRDALLGQVWGVHGDVDTHTLETHIYRLRAKLHELVPHPGDIITRDGAYALVFA